MLCVLAWVVACVPSLTNSVVATASPGLYVENATEAEVVCQLRVGDAGTGALAAADLLGPTEVLPPGASVQLPPEALPEAAVLDLRLEDCNGDRLLERRAVPRGPGLRVVLRQRPSRLRGPGAGVGATE